MDLKSKIEAAASKFENIATNDLFDIVTNAKNLSLLECFDVCLIDPESLSAEETKYCEMLHRHGRALGVRDAGEKLFYQMQTKVGAQVAADYLKQMGAEFSVTKTGNPNGTFSFNINIPEVK